MVKRILSLFILVCHCFGVTYQLLSIDRLTLAAIITGASPSSLAANVGVQSQTIRFDGIQSTDTAISWIQPSPNSQCPLLDIRVTGNNQLTGDFLNTAASACTPASGTYVAVIFRPSN